MATEKEDVKADEVTPKPSEKWLSKLKERKPQLDWDNDPEAPYTAFDDYDNEVSGKLSKFEQSDQKMKDIFLNNPDMAVVFSDVANGENPALALVKHFGEEALSAKDDPETADKFVQAQQDYLDKMSKSKSIEEEQIANMDASIETLKAFAAEKGMEEKEAAEFSDGLFQLADDIFMCRFTSEMLEKLYLGIHHDEDVKDAAEMGEIEGKNKKIRTESKNSLGDGLPVVPSTAPTTAKKPLYQPKRDMFKLK